MQNQNKIRLRDRREPGHLWADNEIYDVFGDELGATGIGVYMTLARLSYGNGSGVRKSLRDLAKHARMSKDSVSRSIQQMVQLGLVVETKSERPRLPSTYSLTNVKELAREYVSKAVHQTVSVGDSCETEQPGESLGTAREMTYFEAYTRQPSNCLTQRQFEVEDENQEIEEPLSHTETELSQKQPKLSRQKDAFNKTQDTRQELLPPTPFQGDARDPERVARFEELNAMRERLIMGRLPWELWLEQDLVEHPPKPAPDAEFVKCATAREAANLVMRRCNLIGARLAVVIAAAIELAETGEHGGIGDLGELAWRRYTQYQSIAAGLRYAWGVRKFFGEGHWLTPHAWPREKQRSRL